MRAVGEPIYLDHNSTTPVAPPVLEAMLPYFTLRFGNPSNRAHRFGCEASDAVERARAEVGTLLGAEPGEILFTSGATESNNLAILGAARNLRGRGDHVVTVVVEHKAVLAPCRQLEREGWRVTRLPVDGLGRVSIDDVARAITPRTVLVSVMLANNEIGTLQPIPDIGQLCEERGVVLHTDAVQAVGKLPVRVGDLGVDLLSVSAHKMYGPKGAGALYVRGGVREGVLAPLLYGAGQECGLRPGTPAAPNLVGLGAACRLALDSPECPSRLRSLRDRLRHRLLEAAPDARVLGDPSACLPDLLCVAFPGTDGDALIHALQGVAVSQGASCSSGSFEPSHVLRAIGLCDDLARASLRFGVGRFTTEEEVDRAAWLVAEAIKRVAAKP